jgi:hypothetical protein
MAEPLMSFSKQATTFNNMKNKSFLLLPTAFEATFACSQVPGVNTAMTTI